MREKNNRVILYNKSTFRLFFFFFFLRKIIVFFSISFPFPFFQFDVCANNKTKKYLYIFWMHHYSSISVATKIDYICYTHTRWMEWKLNRMQSIGAWEFNRMYSYIHATIQISKYAHSVKITDAGQWSKWCDAMQWNSRSRQSNHNI